MQPDERPSLQNEWPNRQVWLYLVFLEKSYLVHVYVKIPFATYKTFTWVNVFSLDWNLTVGELQIYDICTIDVDPTRIKMLCEGWGTRCSSSKYKHKLGHTKSLTTMTVWVCWCQLSQMHLEQEDCINNPVSKLQSQTSKQQTWLSKHVWQIADLAV